MKCIGWTKKFCNINMTFETKFFLLITISISDIFPTIIIICDHPMAASRSLAFRIPRTVGRRIWTPPFRLDVNYQIHFLQPSRPYRDDRWTNQVWRISWVCQNLNPALEPSGDSSEQHANRVVMEKDNVSSIRTFFTNSIGHWTMRSPWCHWPGTYSIALLVNSLSPPPFPKAKTYLLFTHFWVWLTWR